jgi:hypothetical protein
MNWEEAQTAMRQGFAVRHEYFTSDEYFYMRNGHVVCEDGYPTAGWYTGEEWQKTGWSIVENT